MKLSLCIVAAAVVSAAPAAAQEVRGPGPTVTLSAGVAAITDHRGNPSVPLSIGLAAKTPGTEWTIVAGRFILVPGVGGGFGVETGFNLSPWRDGRYGGVVISRVGTGEDAIISAGLRAGVRPRAGRGRRLEARVELARDHDPDGSDWGVFMAYVSIGYDLGRRASR